VPSRLFGSQRCGGNAESFTDGAGYVSERDVFRGGVQNTARGCAFHGEPVELRRIITVDCWPPVPSVPDVGGKAFLPRGADEHGHEAVIVAAMHGWRETQHDGAHAAIDKRQTDPRVVTARRPIYVRTNNYNLSRANARSFAVLMVIMLASGVVALLTRPSLPLPCLFGFCLAGLLGAQSAATATWLRRHRATPAAEADAANHRPI
jgi:hypothetical protein